MSAILAKCQNLQHSVPGKELPREAWCAMRSVVCKSKSEGNAQVHEVGHIGEKDKRKRPTKPFSPETGDFFKSCMKSRLAVIVTHRCSHSLGM